MKNRKFIIFSNIVTQIRYYKEKTSSKTEIKTWAKQQ